MNGIEVRDTDNTLIENEVSDIIIDVANLVIEQEGGMYEYDIDIHITDDDYIRKINKEHRNIDKPTDVLSFPHLDGKPKKTDINPETGRIYLGEIVISEMMAKKQANEIGNSYIREMAFLCLHGILHLFGQDHIKEEDEKKMLNEQKRIIRRIENEIIIDENTIKKAIDEAKKALNMAYSPYSKFKVGSVLITTDDKVYTGANIENSSFGASICAERVSIFKAVSFGDKKYKLIAIASHMDDFIYPCGICRQVMSEFFFPWTKIVVTNKAGDYKIYRLNELLLKAFTKFDREG